MAEIKIETPEITTVFYRQVKGDKDYGSCLWARFNFDTKNYSLTIESDCGCYQYGWVPTPTSESFFHLCSRFNCEYLLYKISDRSVIDSKKTWNNVKDLVEDIAIIPDVLNEYEWEELESACYHCADERDVADAIFSVLNDSVLHDRYETEDFWYAIEKDYPVNAKKIVEVFRDHIQPELRKLSGYKAKETDE